MTRGASIIKQAEAEYEEPFLEILQGFADMGYSAAETARILGYKDGHSVYQWLKRNGVTINFVPGHQTESFRQSLEKRNKANYDTRAAAMANIKHVCTYQGITAPVAHHADRLGINRKTVWHRMKTNPSGGPEVWFRPVWSGVGGNGRTKASYKNHPWKRSEYGRFSGQSAQG